MIDESEYTRLVAFAAQIVGRQDARDVVQDVCVKFLNGDVPAFRNQSTRETWLFAIVKYTALLWRKDRERRQAIEVPFNHPSRQLNCITPNYDDAIDAERSIRTLSPIHQQVLRSFPTHGSYTSLAQALGLTRGQVRGRLYRARLKLRALR